MIAADYNPFLCNDCQSLGYCNKNEKKHGLYEQTKQLFNRAPSENIVQKLINALPLSTTITNKGTVAAKQMQFAHDAYHQQDYETAFLNYKVLIIDGCSHWEAFLGLSLCSFHFEEYDNSLRYAEQIEIVAFSGWENALIAFSVVCTAKQQAKNIFQG